MFLKLTMIDKSQLKSSTVNEFLFDWTRQMSEQSETVACTFDGKIVGLVEFERQYENRFNFMHLIEVDKAYRGKGVAGKLLAYVAKDALEQPTFEGFVVFESKTVLFNYYQEKYGAKPVGVGNKLFFDKEASERLVAEYIEAEDIL